MLTHTSPSLSFPSMASRQQLTPIKGAKVLMVGAGGIGCELLKTLALSGFQDIHIESNVSRILPLAYCGASGSFIARFSSNSFV